MSTLANIEDLDEMPQYAAFHLGFHCLLGLKQSLGTEVHLNFVILNSDPLICGLDHPTLIVSNPDRLIHWSIKGYLIPSICINCWFSVHRVVSNENTGTSTTTTTPLNIWYGGTG